MRRVGVELHKLPFDSFWYDLPSDVRIDEHLIAVHMDQHRTSAALDHLLPFHDLLSDRHQTLLLVLADSPLDRLLGRLNLLGPLFRRSFRLTWLEALTDGAEEPLVSHFVALSAEFKVF